MGLQGLFNFGGGTNKAGIWNDTCSYSSFYGTQTRVKDFWFMLWGRGCGFGVEVSCLKVFGYRGFLPSLERKSRRRTCSSFCFGECNGTGSGERDSRQSANIQASLEVFPRTGQVLYMIRYEWCKGSHCKLTELISSSPVSFPAH